MTGEQLLRLRGLGSLGGMYGLTHGDMAAIQAALDERTSTQREIQSVLTQLDELAETWGDEGQFRRCRDRLRKL